MNGGDDSNDDPAELQPEPQTPGQAMVRNVVAQFRRPDFKPPVLPATAIELLELSRKPDVTFAAVRVVVERDPVIVARVLQLAQSSYYARGAKVKTLHDAMLRLGLVTLGQVFFEASVASRLFRAQGYDNEMEMLRRHSVATGRIARILARRCSVPDENAFLAGILHDIGLAAAMIVIVSVPRGTVVPSFAEAFPLIVEAHTTIGEQLCRAWKLPDPVIAAVAGHHTPPGAASSERLSRVIQLADDISTKLGAGQPHGGRTEPDPDQFAALGIAPAMQVVIMAEAKLSIEGA